MSSDEAADETSDLDDSDGGKRPSLLSGVMMLTVAAVVSVAVLCVLSIVFVFRKDIELMKRRDSNAPSAALRRSKRPQSLPPPAANARRRGASPKPRGRSVPPLSSRQPEAPRGHSPRFRRPWLRDPGSKPALRPAWCTPTRRPREPGRALSALFFADSRDSRLECLICLEPMLGSGGALVTLPCGHEFHQPCFDSWRRSRATGDCCCPTCRQPLPHDAAALSNA